MGDLKSLFEKIKDVVPQGGQEEMMENLMKKNFSLKSMQTLYNSTLSLGSMSGFMSMIPGIGSQLAGAVSLWHRSGLDIHNVQLGKVQRARFSIGNHRCS